MRIRQLEAFRATVVTGTMSAAAEALKTSQPTVSRLLSDLEYSLGFQLLERQKGKVTPTQEGMDFYQRLEEVFDSLSKLRSAADDIKRDRSKHLRIISLPTLTMSVIPDILDRVFQKHSQLTVELMSVDTARYFPMIKTSEADIAIGLHMGELPGIEQIHLANVPFSCVVPLDHRLAGKAEVQVSDLEGESFISLSEDQELLFREHDRVLSDAGVQLKKRIYTQNSAAAYSMVQKGHGVAILEPFSGGIWKNNGVLLKPFRPKIEYRFTAFVKSSVRSQRSARDIIKTASEIFKSFESSPQDVGT